MTRIHHIYYIALLFSLFTNFNMAFAGPEANTIQSPPWLVYSRQFLMVVFHADAKAVQAVLPKGIQVQPNQDGKASLMLEIYNTERTNGIPIYQMAFIVADINDYPSRNGTPGHFALWGRVDSPDALRQFREVYGFPYDVAESITVDMHEGKHRGVIEFGDEGSIRAQIEPLVDQTFKQDGVVNMVGMLSPNSLTIGEVPYFTHGNVGKIIELEIKNPKGDPILTLLKGAQPVWSMVSVDQMFSYANQKHISLLPKK
jgi:hypothetical protein